MKKWKDFNINLKNLEMDFCYNYLKYKHGWYLSLYISGFNVFRALILYPKENKLNYKLAFFEKFEKVSLSPM